MTLLDPNHVEWCRNQFRIMSEGGSWGIPRSGLIFTKRGNTLVLIARMPHDPAMPITAEQLREQQNSDFEGTVLHFVAAGVDVTDETGDAK
jgi:hypothetical protein